MSPPFAAAAAGEKKKKDRMNDASTATSFAGRSALVGPFVAATFLLASAGANVAVAGSPVLLLVHKFLKKSEGNSLAGRVVKVVALASAWVGWSVAVAAAPLALLFQVPVTPYHALAVYAPLLVIAFKRNREVPYPKPCTVLLRVLFDLPLVATGWALRRCGVRLFTPFASIIDDDIVQGAMPFAPDVPELVGAPYNVCAVVNMCKEWPGPTAAYAAHGVAQCRLPFQDTTAPSEDALREGAAFIRAQLDANPGKRVYVHCKGGIARASTMALAHYIINEGREAHAAVEVLKSKRDVVLTSAADYSSIRALDAERAAAAAAAAR